MYSLIAAQAPSAYPRGFKIHRFLLLIEVHSFSVSDHSSNLKITPDGPHTYLASDNARIIAYSSIGSDPFPKL